MPEHAVIVSLKPTAELDLDEIEDDLAQAADEVGGEYDGNGIALDDNLVELFFYGPDADQLYTAVEPVITRLAIGPGSFAVKRYGEADDPDVREVRVDL